MIRAALRIPTTFTVTLLATVVVAGCASVPRDVVTTVPAANYASTFEAAKATLRDYRFVIERVDARAGVITTRAKPTAGLITPWDKEQSTTRQELEELINQETRTVRIEFVPGSLAQSAAGKEPVISARNATLTPADDATGDLVDLRNVNENLECRVIVAVERLHRSGRLLSTKTIRGTRNYEDPELNRRGLAPLSGEALGRDSALEQRLIAAIQQKAQNSSGAAAVGPASMSTPSSALTPAAAPVATPQSAPSGEPGFEPVKVEPVGGNR